LNHLAVGHNDGTVTIRAVEGLEANKGQELINLDNIIQTLTNSQEWIECMRYSPSLTKLAVGSHDNKIYVYSISLE
jgi:WD40 repeat protein